jgi:hypothetical protein
MPLATLLLILVRAQFLGRHRLALENLALRQQLAVLKRKVPHPRPNDRDRRFWLLRRALHDGWKDCLHLVRPDTVVPWHSKGWRWYSRRKSRRRRPGRPAIGWKLARLIRRLSIENPPWGAPRITSELLLLLLLGYSVSETTVSRYMARSRRPGRGQSWMTFLRNHLKVTAAPDFFTVPTVLFTHLYVFVVLRHDRRRIRHVAVTAHPTAEWTARQGREAFPGDGSEPRFLLRDRDGIYGDDFSRQVKAMCIEELLTAPRQPWMNCDTERVIGSIRRECTDHLLVLNDRHRLATLLEYVACYNADRTHLSLDRNAPIARVPERTPAAEVHGTPVLGGLHHRYRAVA